MKPTSKREVEIVECVDKSARNPRWSRRVGQPRRHGMRIAVGFQMSVAEEQFLESYVASRRQNPIKNSGGW